MIMMVPYLMFWPVAGIAARYVPQGAAEGRDIQEADQTTNCC
jgi:hypothetical protein